MSEKRFYRASVCGDDGLYDKEDGCIIVNVRSNIDLDDNWNTVVDKLNEQQELIEELQEENKQLKLTLSEYGVDLKAFEIFKQKIGYYDKVIDDELRKKLETALTNTEKCREQIKSQLDKAREDDDADERQVHLLVNYNLELLDVKLRLKDFIEHLHLIQFD